MKKTLISLAILACTGAGTTYYAGMETEQQYQALVAKLNQQKGVKARSLSYDRQFLGAAAQTRIEVTNPNTLAQLAELGLPASFVLDHDVKHLPWQVQVHTALRMSKGLERFKEGFDADVAEPIVLDSVTSLLGKTHFDGRVAMAHWRTEQGNTRFYPLSLSGDYQGDQLTLDATWNGLEIKSDQGRMVMSGIKLNELKQFAEPGLAVGQSTLTLGAVTINADHQFYGLSNVSLNQSSALEQGKFSQHSVLRSEEIKVNNDRFKALELDLTLSDFNAKGVKKLSSLYGNLLAEESNQAAADAFLEGLLALLEKGGKVKVDKLAMNTSTGDLAGQGNLKVNAGELTRIENLTSLLEGQFQLKMPKQMGSLEPVEPQTLTVLVERGWVRDEGRHISMNFQIDKQELSVNGQPLASLL